MPSLRAAVQRSKIKQQKQNKISGLFSTQSGNESEFQNPFFPPSGFFSGILLVI